jgi:hypothetical protein
MVCSPIICGSTVFRTLIDGCAGLNVHSVEAFDKLGVPRDHLRATKPFTGVTDGTTTPLRQVRLPVTFGIPGSYRTEHIDFDIAYINLPYNAILGYPALAQFMVATHHAYNVVKMSGAGGDIITIRCDERDAALTLECAFKTAATAHPAGDGDTPMLGGSHDGEESTPDSSLREVIPPAFVVALAEELLVSPAGKRKPEFMAKRMATKNVALDSCDSGLTVIIGANLPDK